MKRYNIILKASCLWIVMLLGIEANAQQECGTQLNTEQEKNAWLVRHQQFVTAQAAEMLPPTTTNKWIPVSFHIVRLSNGTGGISLADARLALERCNTAFAPTNIRFYECNSEFVDVDSLYDFNSGTEQTALVSSRLVVGAANVFIVNSIPGSCGYTFLPGQGPPGYANNFIVMDFHCMNSASQTSLQHEFGHFFDLLHTHDTPLGAELVTRTTGKNCDTAGDGFCDTPADPGLVGLVTANCVYTGTGTDSLGVAYKPDTSNIMSYSQKPCRVNWSAQQIAKMNFTVSDLGMANRNSLSCSYCILAVTTSLPANVSGTYQMGEFYTTGNYVGGKNVLSEVTSNVNLNTATVNGSDLKIISTGGITFLPGFDFDAATAQLNELSAIVDPCGGTGNLAGPGQSARNEEPPVILPGSNRYTVYPNPFKNSFTLKLDLEEDALISVTLYDMVGKMIDRIAQSQNRLKGLVQFDYSNDQLPRGMYVCVIEMNNRRYTEKLIQY